MATLPFNKGICENCKMKGLVTRRPFVMAEDSLNAKFDVTSPPVRAVCVTCHQTPDGAVSENLRHKRLPGEEYK